MTTQATHTPGPWKSVKGARPTRPDIVADCGLICSLEYAGADDSTADAHLIAAAPEMLEALRGLLDQLEAAGIYIPGEDSGQWHGAEGLSFRKASEAIAKAEGRAGE